LTAGSIDAGEMLRTVAAKDFAGRVLPFAQRDSAVLKRSKISLGSLA
jgi:hypothetical protein